MLSVGGDNRFEVLSGSLGTYPYFVGEGVGVPQTTPSPLAPLGEVISLSL